MKPTASQQQTPTRPIKSEVPARTILNDLREQVAFCFQTTAAAVVWPSCLNWSGKKSARGAVKPLEAVQHALERRSVVD